MPSPIAPHGSRQFLVNGVPFVFRGGGWSEDLFLRYSSADTADQIAMIKNLGLNGIRTEGKQMPDDFYEQMDRAGILIDAGFQCCDAWELAEHRQADARAHDFRGALANSALTIGAEPAQPPERARTSAGATTRRRRGRRPCRCRPSRRPTSRIR